MEVIAWEVVEEVVRRWWRYQEAVSFIFVYFLSLSLSHPPSQIRRLGQPSDIW